MNERQVNIFCLPPVMYGSPDTSGGKGFALGMAVENGPTASAMWRYGDKAFQQISGRRFAFISGYDNQEYEVDRGEPVRPTKEQVEEFLPFTTPSFQTRIQNELNTQQI